VVLIWRAIEPQQLEHTLWVFSFCFNATLNAQTFLGISQ
jgi:hypothetical protein